eukprot:9503425-Pyramimonas_sp.AAC.3
MSNAAMAAKWNLTILASGVPPGGFMGRLDGLSDRLGFILGISERSFGVSGLSWTILGVSGEVSGAVLELQSEPG